jgi:NADH:ubiquinone oxidoreductase subunit 6 (subunit J)
MMLTIAFYVGAVICLFMTCACFETAGSEKERRYPDHNAAMARGMGLVFAILAFILIIAAVRI